MHAAGGHQSQHWNPGLPRSHSPSWTSDPGWRETSNMLLFTSCTPHCPQKPQYHQNTQVMYPKKAEVIPDSQSPKQLTLAEPAAGLPGGGVEGRALVPDPPPGPSTCRVGPRPFSSLNPCPEYPQWILMPHFETLNRKLLRAGPGASMITWSWS